MADQDISLKLQAQLEEGTVQSDALRLAESVAQAFEQQFQNLGQKIAESIVSSVTQAQQRIVDQFGQVIPPTGQGAPGAPPAAPQLPPQVSQGVPSGQAPNQLPSFQAGFGQEQYQTRPELLRADLTTQFARQMQTAQKVGLDIPMTGQERAGLEEAIGVGEETITKNIETTRTLTQEIKGLQETITGLQQTMNRLREVSDEERTARGFQSKEAAAQSLNDMATQKARAQNQLDQLTAESGTAGERIGVLRGAIPARGTGMGLALGLAGAAAPIIGAAGQLPGAFRASEAAEAAMGNFGARAALGGDVERMIAARELGGIENIQGAAGIEAGLGIGGNILGAGASALGAGLPIPGAQVAGIAGAGYFGTQAVRGMAGFGAAQRQAQEDILAREMERQQELFQFTRAGRGVGIGAFEQAQQAGGAEFSNLMMGLPGARIPTMQGGIPTGGTQGLRGFAAGMGIGTQQFQETMGGLGQGMGGMFFQEGQPRLQQMPDVAVNALQMQAAGLRGAPGLMGQMMQGMTPNAAQERRTQGEELRQMFEDAVSAGLDKARAGQALQFMATQAAQGLGAAGAARIGFGQQVGLAQRLFGAEGIEGPEMGFIQKGITNVQQGTRGGGGITGLAGLAAAQDINRRFFQGKLSPADVVNLQQTVTDPGGIEALAEDYGVEVNGEEVAAAMGETRVQETGRLARTALSGMRGAERLMVGQAAGARTLSERVAAGRFGEFGAGPTRGEPLAGQIGPPAPFRVGEQAALAPAIGGPAGQLAAGMAQVDATKIVTGLQTLGRDQLPAINRALSELVTRAEEVLTRQDKPRTMLQIFANPMGLPDDKGNRSAPSANK